MNLGIGTWPQRRAKVRPHDVAIEFEGHEYTHATVSDRVTRLANALTAGGVQRGDRVVHLGFNHPAALELFFAAGLMGATCVLLNPRLKLAEVEYIVGDCAPRVLAFGAEQADNTTHLATAHPGLTLVSIDAGTPTAPDVAHDPESPTKPSSPAARTPPSRSTSTWKSPA